MGFQAVVELELLGFVIRVVPMTLEVRGLLLRLLGIWDESWRRPQIVQVLVA